MPWHCPFCSTIIKHTAEEKIPRPGTRYRCHVCRVGLMYNPQLQKLINVRSDDDGARPVRRSRHK